MGPRGRLGAGRRPRWNAAAEFALDIGGWLVHTASVALTGKQRRHLRGLAHSLDPVVHLGKEGITEGLIDAVNVALTDHELIKVRVAQIVAEERETFGPELAKATKAELVGTVGHVLIYYRRHPHEPKIELPRGAARATVATD